MTSTVLDVTVMLLCVSASVVALGAPGGDVGNRGPTADDVADRLVTETVTVTYESSESPNGTRTIHATRAELLAILVSEGRGKSADSETNNTFRSRSRAAISGGLGPRTRIDVRVTAAKEEDETVVPTETSTERSAGRYPSGNTTTSEGETGTTGISWWSAGDTETPSSTNETETPSLAASATGTPWDVELREGRNDRNGRNGRSDRDGDASAREEWAHETVTIGMEPSRNAEITTTIVTQPAPSGAETNGLVRIVVRRW